MSVSSTVSCSNEQMVERTPRPISSTQILATAKGCRIYGSPLFRRMVLCASAAISKAILINRRSPGFILDLRERKSDRYSRRISFFSCSSFKLYFGTCAKVSIDDEFTVFAPGFEVSNQKH